MFSGHRAAALPPSRQSAAGSSGAASPAPPAGSGRVPPPPHPPLQTPGCARRGGARAPPGRGRRGAGWAGPGGGRAGAGAGGRGAPRPTPRSAWPAASPAARHRSAAGGRPASGSTSSPAPCPTGTRLAGKRRGGSREVNPAPAPAGAHTHTDTRRRERASSKLARRSRTAAGRGDFSSPSPAPCPPEGPAAPGVTIPISPPPPAVLGGPPQHSLGEWAPQGAGGYLVRRRKRGRRCFWSRGGRNHGHPGVHRDADQCTRCGYRGGITVRSSTDRQTDIPNTACLYVPLYLAGCMWKFACSVRMHGCTYTCVKVCL